MTEENGVRNASDIKPPKGAGVELVGGIREVRTGYRRGPWPRHLWIGVASLILLFAVSFGVFYHRASKQLSISASGSLNDLKGGIADLKRMDAESAERKFMSAGDAFDSGIAGFLSKIKFAFGAAGDAIAGLKNISQSGAAIAGEIDFLENNLFDLALNRHGEKIITSLRRVQRSLDSIDSAGGAISSKIGAWSSSANEFVDLYVPLRLNIASAREFLDFFLGWLEYDKTRHIAVLLQNPSEIRPGGGFLGSFADVALNKGSVESVEVYDINDADRLLETKTIPPKPLQHIVTNWRAADANWFFDFPTSAEYVLRFLESSKLFADKSLAFDGAIAITPRVITDVLSLTGPIDLAGRKVPFDQDNLLLELQREVQVGQSTKVTYPKKVLEDLLGALTGRFKLLDSGKKRELLRMLKERLATKDVMIYLKDDRLESFLHDYGVSGKVSDVPSGVAASYLAVVDANIGGGKSDLFMKQSVTAQNQINADGTVSVHLVVERKHEGTKTKYWWYRVENINYLQVFTSADSHLVNFQGGIERRVSAPVDYSRKGYRADDFVRSIESSEEKVFNYPAVSTHNESGKKVFSTWVKTRSAGESKTVFDYTHRLALAPTDGSKYEFVFDKQAGAARRYKFEISAPIGFRFRENGLSVYEYEFDDLSDRQAGLPASMVLRLTLEKI